jgi:predicted small lipoprotein YifL
VRIIYSAVLLLAIAGLSGCGLRGDLYLDEPAQQSNEPAVNTAVIDQAEDDLGVPGISDPDLLETEEEASSGGLDVGAPAP